MKLGAVPPINLPIKLHETEIPAERHNLNKVEGIAPSSKQTEAYKDIPHFEKSISNLKLYGWEVTNINNNYHVKSFTSPYTIPHYEVIVNANLEFTILVYGWSLPHDSFLYKDYQRSMKNVTVSALLKEIKTYVCCEGLQNKVEPSQSIEYSIPCLVNVTSLLDGSPTEMKIYSRAKDCYVFVKDLARKKSCDRCGKLELKELKEVKERVKKEKIINTPAKRNAPLSKTHRHRVELALKVERAAHKTDIERMQKEIENASIPLQNEGLNTDFFEIMENNKNVTPFMKLFFVFAYHWQPSHHQHMMNCGQQIY